MAITWKALAYTSDLTSAVASEGVVRSTADSSLVVTVSTADSKAVSAGSLATSLVNSEGVVRSTADSSLTVVVGSAGTSAGVSTADSKAVSAGAAASVADSKAVSAASIALSYTNSEGVIRSTADSSLTVTVATADSKAVSAASIALSYTNSEGVVRSTADSSLAVRAINLFGAATGNVGMSGNQLTDQVIHTTATTASMTGLTAAVGKFVFCTADLSPYICTASI